jgi:hypothetical protein
MEDSHLVVFEKGAVRMHMFFIFLSMISITALTLASLKSASSEEGPMLPEIISTQEKSVPSCTTAIKLMQFVHARNATLKTPRMIENKFNDLASIYKSIGICVQRSKGACIGVRWDYAFFQMLVETNYLTFTGGVRPSDNNFAGIGATIPGKPGERFATVHQGVHAHLQHVLMYAGIVIDNPIAERTRAVQSTVHEIMGKLDRPVTFSDLATLWTGTDQNTYAASIERTAEKFSESYCQK